MGELVSLAKARMELEELYLGIPDDSVNLTFQDLADVQQKAKANAISDHQNQKKILKKSTSGSSMEPIQELPKTPKQPSKLPSLDFSRGLQAASKGSDHNYHHHHDHYLHHHEDRDRDHDHDHDQDNAFDSDTDVDHHHHHRRHDDGENNNMHAIRDSRHRYLAGDHPSHHATTPRGVAEFRHAGVLERSLAYDDALSVVSMASNYAGHRRRPGIPHSNICTVCSTYIYIFRHRCLVCGRVYCRQCVFMGMGEMAEGRKCIPCLGRRFSQRYIKRAGKVGCCSRYPSAVKQAELKWAEKGPRRSGERGYGRSAMMSMMTSRSVTTAAAANPSRTTHAVPSFVASSPAPYSPYTPPTHHHLPL